MVVADGMCIWWLWMEEEVIVVKEGDRKSNYRDGKGNRDEAIIVMFADISKHGFRFYYNIKT
jgi:hypothetical protein